MTAFRPASQTAPSTVVGFRLSLVWLLLSLSVSQPPGSVGAAGQSSRLALPCASPASLFVDSGQSLGNDPSLGVALGDLNGDASPDALIANGAGPREQVWLNLGGVFSFTQELGDFLNTPAVALADVDGDTDLDAVTIGFPALVYRNNGQAQFTQVQFLTGGDNRAGTLGDLDGAFGPDLVLAGNGSTLASQVFWNTGSPTTPFTPGPTLALSDTVQVLVGQLDAGPASDLLLINADGQPSQIWLNGGAGSFSAGPVLTPPAAAAAALGDLDADGDQDLWLGYAPPGGSQVWLNDGSGVFTASGSVLGAAVAAEVALGDLDADGDPDALVAGSVDEVWLNDGAGQFCLTQTLSGSSSLGVALADLDGDLDLDAFMAGSGPNRVWLNQGGVVAQPDLTLSLLGNLHTRADVETYAITVHNDQPGPAQAVRLALTPGEGVRVTAWDLPVPGACTLYPAECWLGDLAGGASVTVSVEILFEGLRPQFGNVRHFRLAVTSTPADPVAGNNLLDAYITLYACERNPNLCSAERWICDSLPSHAPALAGARGGLVATRPRMMQAAAARLTAEFVDWFLLSAVRDDVLSPTAAGQHYINLYYTHDPELSALLGADDALFAQAGATLLLWQPNLAALLAGQGDTVTITAEQVQAVQSFLQSLSAAGSAALQQTIAAELARQPLEPLAGLTMGQARALLVGHALFLPFAQRPAGTGP